MSKPTLLYWGDSPTIDTGFGIVAQNILPALAEKYDITVVGINDTLPYKDPQKYPYKIYSPALTGDQYGYNLFVQLLKSSKWDYVFLLNDAQFGMKMSDIILEQRTKQGFKFVHYLPIDNDFVPSSALSKCVLADKLVFYTEKYANKYKTAFPQLEDNITYIHHGCEAATELASKNRKKKLKKELFGLDEDITLFTFVGRNQWRKDIATLALGFKLAWMEDKNIRLYLHCARKDMGGDVESVTTLATPPSMSEEDNYEAMSAFIFTHPSFNVTNSLSRNQLRMVYEASDATITATLGEGWGLPITESMSYGVPVLAPKNSAITEIIGDDERGTYWSSDIDDNDLVMPVPNTIALFRKTKLSDIAEKLIDFTENKKDYLAKLKPAYEWTQQRLWPTQAKQWVKLFSQL